MSKNQNVVIFRRRKNTGGVLAVFPEMPADSSGLFLKVYENGELHSDDYYSVLKTTVPATEQEAATLIAELVRLGYKLRVMKRSSERQHLKRFCKGRSMASPPVKSG